MGKNSNLEQEVGRLADPICAAHGVDLVEVRALPGKGATTLRITIDRARPASDPTPGSGVTLEDCTAVSRDLSTALDVHEDLVGNLDYRLEVSSPGLERPLVKLKDFEKFAGAEVKVKTYGPVESRKAFTGRLIGVEGDAVQVETDGKTFRIPHDAIARAHLVHKF